MILTPDILQEADRLVMVEISTVMLRVTLADGRIIATPPDWYPRLAQATPEQWAQYELSIAGIHWPGLDEDLSVRGMLRGERPPQTTSQGAAGASAQGVL